MAAYQAAVQAGLGPNEFWELTPYLCRLAVEAATLRRREDLWLGAALNRVKKLPSFAVFTGVRTKQEDLKARMMDAFNRHNAARAKG